MIDWTKPVRTKGDKLAVRILSTTANGAYPVIGHIGKSNDTDRWTLGGSFIHRFNEHSLDLENVPEEQYCWVPVFEEKPDKLIGGTVCIKRSDAVSANQQMVVAHGEFCSTWNAKPVGILKVKLERRFDE